MSAIEQEITAHETTPTPSATPSSAAPPEAPAPAAPLPDPGDRRAVIARAMSDKQANNRGKHAAFQPRGEAGKFAPGAPQVVESAPAPVAITRQPMPQSWNKEFAQHWETAPPELVNRFVQREEEMKRGIEPLKARAAEAEELLSEFKPYEWILKAENATPKAAIGNLLRTAAILRTGTPLDKARSVAEVMQQFNIPLQHLQQLLGQSVPSNGQAPPQVQLDPNYNALAQQVEQLKQERIQERQRYEQEAERRALSVVEQFRSDTQAHPHFERVQERMLQILQTPALLGDASTMSEAQKLQAAYDAAVRLEGLNAAPTAPATAPAPAVSHVTRARAAAVQVSGAPAQGPAPAVNPSDRRAVIAHAMRQAARI